MQDKEFWKLFENTGTPAAYLLYAKSKQKNGRFHQHGAPTDEDIKSLDEPT